MTIDYSKWDNIDTDSEPEYEVPLPPALVPASAATQRPAPAPTTTPVAATPAASAASSSATATAATATPTPAPDSDSEYIQAVTVVCDGEKGFPAWYPTRVAADHLVFLWPASPVPELIGIPLVCHCVGTISERLPDLDNQKITYINIDPESGFAPPLWQSGVGTVIVARKDKKALLPQHFEGVWMYCDYILDLFGEGQGAPRWLYNRPAFEGWWGRYCQRQKQHRDEFQDVRSPYEM